MCNQLWTADKKCVTLEPKETIIYGDAAQGYDVSNVNIDDDIDQLIAVSIDMTRLEIDKMNVRGWYTGTKWNLENITYEHYLVYEYGGFLGVGIEFTDGNGNYGSSVSKDYESTWITRPFFYNSKLFCLGDVTGDSEEYKVLLAGGYNIYSRKGNVINLLKEHSDCTGNAAC